ncbi:hypothetical protein [Hyphococcus sp.]|uniref:hypothetical protein n=1 Tax=Hyphococcus sp. TaxID=2038636 RepID=UPI003CCBB75E
MKRLKYYGLRPSGAISISIEGRPHLVRPGTNEFARVFPNGLACELRGEDGERYQSDLKQRNEERERRENSAPHWPSDAPRENYYDLDPLDRASIVKKMNGSVVRQWRFASRAMKEAGSAVV